MSQKQAGISGNCLKILLVFLWRQPKLDPYFLWMVCYGRADLGRGLAAAGDVVFSGAVSSNMLVRLIPDSGPNNHSPWRLWLPIPLKAHLWSVQSGGKEPEGQNEPGGRKTAG